MEIDPSLQVNDFVYDLPASLIAQEPSEKRELSRLLVVDRGKTDFDHVYFNDILRFLVPGDLLIMNDVKVIPARLYAFRPSGARIEVFVLDGHHDRPEHLVLMKPARRIRVGERLRLNDNGFLRVCCRDGKEFRVQMEGPVSWRDYMDRHGLMPLPPYIKRGEADEKQRMDRERYQTVFASRPGAVAAPTAGLHFTLELMDRLKMAGVRLCTVTLWVGWGTFQPVECSRVADHRMASEMYSIPAVTAEEIRMAKSENRRVIAVGTTTTRALESWALFHPDYQPADRQETGLFITPGFQFRVIDALITNFHLPGSSLIMLVSALTGREKILDAYRVAITEKYRFYSYGDAMLII